MTKEERKKYNKAYYQIHKKEIKKYNKAYREAHKEEQKAYRESHKEEYNDYQKSYYQTHKEEQNDRMKAYYKTDVNSSGQTKHSIRCKSRKYLNKHGTKITDYQIHHCCTYNEPYKFIYCSKEMHQLIHSYLREHNIDADSEHYEQIKHLLDDTVILFGISKEEK